MPGAAAGALPELAVLPPIGLFIYAPSLTRRPIAEASALFYSIGSG